MAAFSVQAIWAAGPVIKKEKCSPSVIDCNLQNTEPSVYSMVSKIHVISY